ncbi:unnamed protein product [Amoebophrya sp. A120]|nr:unnamed protein product [Amoebophrya sp. A120]|eukprot:GSA120T00002832001.1
MDAVAENCLAACAHDRTASRTRCHLETPPEETAYGWASWRQWLAGPCSRHNEGDAPSWPRGSGTEATAKGCPASSSCSSTAPAASARLGGRKRRPALSQEQRAAQALAKRKSRIELTPCRSYSSPLREIAPPPEVDPQNNFREEGNVDAPQERADQRPPLRRRVDGFSIPENDKEAPRTRTSFCGTSRSKLSGVVLWFHLFYLLFFEASRSGFLPLAQAQRQRRPDEALPAGLERWIGRDECDEKNGWVQFYHSFARGIQQAQSNNVISPAMLGELQNGTLPERNGEVIGKDESAIAILRELTDNFLKLPEKAFQCGTAMSSVFSMLSTLYDSVNLPVLALRAMQHASIFGSFDYQMKGEDYIDQSPWPITWKESIELSLKRMDRVQKLQRAESWRREKLPRRPSAPKLKILIVSVCEYNNDVTPLYSLSLWNKKRYAEKHGYEVQVHAKGPLLQDQFAGLYEEPPAHRPPAWSKIDAVLLGLREGHDWVMWMDCDSYFMDQEMGINELIDYVLEKEAKNAEQDTGSSAKKPFSDPPLQEFLKKWDAAPGTQESFDKMLASSDGLDQTNIGWDDWLIHPTYEKDGQKRTELIVSEDGLMLNTGIFFVRSSVWAWRFFQKVRRFTFGPRAPITQHPWWEQTAMVYLIQMPFANEKHWAVAPAVSLLDQKHINPYPHLVSSALLTHIAYEESDYIISFSGCKIYSSQDVCNALFFNYFAVSVPNYMQIDDPVLQKWLQKGAEKYR